MRSGVPPDAGKAQESLLEAVVVILVADLSLEAYRLKKTAIPMPQDATGTSG